MRVLISFSSRLVNDHGSAVFGIASVRMKLELEADGVGSEGAARQAGPLDRALAFFDVLLTGGLYGTRLKADGLLAIRT